MNTFTISLEALEFSKFYITPVNVRQNISEIILSDTEQ